MYIKKILSLILIAGMISGCSNTREWNSESAIAPVGKPILIHKQNPSALYGQTNNMNLLVMPSQNIAQVKLPKAPMTQINDIKNISVLLPLSGDYADLGNGIRKSLEIAFLKKPDDKIAVNFYDMSGDIDKKENTVLNAIASNPKLIIGPIFAEDAKLVRKLKPETLPAVSFTSNARALGNGVMTIALLPSQSVEAIVQQINAENKKSLMVFAPNTESGELMAGAAVKSARDKNIEITGLLFYTPGDTDSMKRLANEAADYDNRVIANTKGREILSDILLNEEMDEDDRLYIESQLDEISKFDTLGPAPFDSVLFLGDLNDSQTIVSFLRYYDVADKDAELYGTALWDTPNARSSFSMQNAKYAALPKMDRAFSNTHQQISNRETSRLDSLGYDAANLARGMLNSDLSPATYLLAPSGYIGIDGLFRLLPSGTNERALQIVKLNGELVNAAPTDFLTPLYSISAANISPANWINVNADEIEAADYLAISDDLKKDYDGSPKTIKEFFENKTDNNALTDSASPLVISEEIIEEYEEIEPIRFENFVPVPLDKINQNQIDDVEIIL